MMKKTLVLAMAMVLGVTAQCMPANLFLMFRPGIGLMMPLTDWRQPELLMVMAMVILAANV